MSSSQMSGATTFPLKPPHLTFFRVLPGKLESWSVLLAPPPGTGSSCNRRRGCCEGKANMSMCFYFLLFFLF